MTTDPSAATAYWTVLQGQEITQVPATLISYDSGTGTAIYGLTLTSTQTGAFVVKPGGTYRGSFALSVILSGINILQLVPYPNGQLIVSDAPVMPPV